MKFAVIALLGVSLTAGAASAAGRATDLDFLKANRCKGLATTIQGVIDPTALNEFIKAERKTRGSHVVDRAESEFDRARREAKSEDRKARLTAELTGECQAYLGGATSVAKQ